MVKFVLVSVLILEAILTGLLPITTGYFFSSFDKRDIHFFWVSLFTLLMCVLALNISATFKPYIQMKLCTVLRAIKTQAVISGDLNSSRTNIPQRIQEDIKIMLFNQITVYSEYFVSGLIVIQLFILNIHQPILILSALVATGFSIGISIVFFPRLKAAEYAVQEAEATYRSSISDALESKKKDVILPFLKLANISDIFSYRTKLEYGIFLRFQSAILQKLPYIVLGSQVIAGKMSLALMMEHASSFALIVVNAGILIQMFPTLTQSKAAEQRVKELEND